jgi:hypothetical protein
MLEAENLSSASDGTPRSKHSAEMRQGGGLCQVFLCIGFSLVTDPAGAARRIIDWPPERRAGCKGAPGCGAAERTLAAEHRSGTTWTSTGGSGGISEILLVGSELLCLRW